MYMLIDRCPKTSAEYSLIILSSNVAMDAKSCEIIVGSTNV